MSLLDYVYSPGIGTSFVGKRIRDCVPRQAVQKSDKFENQREIPEHEFQDSIGGDTSNYKGDQ